MGKYTIHDDPLIDQEIEKRINEIVDILIKNIPNIYSIVLTGGFGKGEGSVISSNGLVTPLRDFDFIIVFKKNVPSGDINNVKRQLQNNPSTSDSYNYNQEFSIDISATTLERINLFPDIMTYDFKNSKIVYGVDVRPKIRWSAKDIPLRSGARLLFQKSTALIGVFSTNYLIQKEVPQTKVNIFMRETSKVYVEIGGALCILAGQYDSYCSKRVNILKKIYKKKFPELYEIIPDLINKIEVSTNYKLDPANNSINRDPFLYWFETRNDLGEVMKYYFDKYIRISFNDWMEFAALLEKQLMREYYVSVIKNYIITKHYPKNKLLIKLLNIAFNIKENIAYSKLELKNHNFSLSLSKGISAPSIKLFSVCPLILFSIDEEGRINNKYVDEVLKRLHFVKIGKKTFKNQWEEARLKCLKLIDSLPSM